jgi:hypothetical protein
LVVTALDLTTASRVVRARLGRLGEQTRRRWTAAARDGRTSRGRRSHPVGDRPVLVVLSCPPEAEPCRVLLGASGLVWARPEQYRSRPRTPGGCASGAGERSQHLSCGQLTRATNRLCFWDRSFIRLATDGVEVAVQGWTAVPSGRCTDLLAGDYRCRPGDHGSAEGDLVWHAVLGLVLDSDMEPVDDLREA